MGRRWGATTNIIITIITVITVITIVLILVLILIIMIMIITIILILILVLRARHGSILNGLASSRLDELVVDWIG